MIQITKEEKDYLVSKGFKYGNDIHKTYTHNPHYYASEYRALLNELYKYRRKRIVKE